MATLSENPDFTYEEEIEYKTLVTKFENGVEQRRSKWANPLRRFRFVYKSRSQTDFETVRDFYNARLGQYESFTWTNPNDSTSYTIRFEADTLRFKRKAYQVYDFEFMAVEVK